MPLSEHEQRILEEIERRLVADDPKFAREVAGSSQAAALKKVRRAIIAFVAGFALLVAGLFQPDLLVFFGIAAFAVMVTAAVLIGSGIKQASKERPSTKQERVGWLARMEERWRKRYERGSDGT